MTSDRKIIQYLTPTLAEHEDVNAPPEAVKVINGIKDRKLNHHSKLFKVDPTYYTWELEERQICLSAPSIHHLCKSVVFENTRWKENIIGDDSSVRYIMVVVQYTDKINSQKLNNYLRDLAIEKRARKAFNLRVTDPETALKLTGYFLP